jgi:hypothetical protein
LRTLLVANSSSVITDIPGYYFITYDVTDPSGNVAETAQRLIQVLASTTGIDEVSGARNLSVYPNPNTGKFTVTTTSTTKLSEIKVIDVLGRVVLTEGYTTGQIDISHITKGVYIVVASDQEGNSFSTKIVIE